MLITLTDGRKIPVEMHKIKIVQRSHLLPSEERLNCLRAVGYNTFLLPAREVFLDRNAALMQPEYWAGKQASIRAGVQEDVYPYPEEIRFKR